MKIIAVKCPSCGADFQVNDDETKYVCRYCGTQILLQAAPETEKEPSSEYDKKMALAKSMEDVYFRMGHGAVMYGGKMGYDAMLNYYADAERAGGATRADYWLSLSRFCVNAGVSGFRDGTIGFMNRALFISSYATYMDKALRYCDKCQKIAIMQEKNQNIARLNNELLYIPGVRNACYIATAVYGSYDCPEVRALRRFRDRRLKKTKRGRAFIKLYYKLSPKLAARLGGLKTLKSLSKLLLDRLVKRLMKKGIENTPYVDGD